MWSRVLSVLAAVASLVLTAPSSAGLEIPPNTFVEVACSEVGGHFFSQVIYAPSAKALVSWGTQTHHHRIRTHETRHCLIDENRWIDAALEYDPIHKVAVLLWPPRFEADIRPHLFRLDTTNLPKR